MFLSSLSLTLGVLRQVAWFTSFFFLLSLLLEFVFYLNFLISFLLWLIEVWPLGAFEDFASPEDPIEGGKNQDSSNHDTGEVKDLRSLLEVLVKRAGEEEETTCYQKPDP